MGILSGIFKSRDKPQNATSGSASAIDRDFQAVFLILLRGVLHFISYGASNLRILRTDHQRLGYEKSHYQHRPSASATQQYGISY